MRRSISQRLTMRARLRMFGKKLAFCVTRHRSPLSIVESPYFTSFGNGLVAFGASKKEYAIDFPSPRTFVENHIEGANGLLKRTVNAVVQMHESAVTLRL
jgi:hypothetical protein